MLFKPVQFHGVRIPGMRELAGVLPRKLQEVPGILQGGIGWQGIIPALAAKMGSIAVDKAIAKLGTPGEFYQQLVDDVMRQEPPGCGATCPAAAPGGYLGIFGVG